MAIRCDKVLREAGITAQLNIEADVTANFHDGETIRRPHLSQDAMHVVLNRLLGEVKLACHFFIGQTLLDQPNQLLLPAAKPQAGLKVQTGNGGLVLGHPLKQSSGE
jgi:hypothetical protein